MSEDKLLEKIEAQKLKLVKTLQFCKTLHDRKVLKESVKLDGLLSDFMKKAPKDHYNR